MRAAGDKKQVYSGIGGQAVMEGVMMKNGDRYAVAVRKPDRTIEVKVSSCEDGSVVRGARRIPFVRGVFSFWDALVLGMRSLNFSASFYDEEEEKKERTREQKEREDRVFMGLTLLLSVAFALILFFALPYFLSTLLLRFAFPESLVVFGEGLLRLLIFVAYVWLISLNRDIRRLFMYHGAEHKCINCVERGLPLTVENVRESSKEHRRCGTSFLLIVMLISILLFMFIRADNPGLQLLFRLLLIPVIAGISYELLMLSGKGGNWFTDLLSRPGLWLQALTTREPEDDMIQVGIASVEAVFDWKSWQESGKSRKVLLSMEGAVNGRGKCV